ncbi:MAG: GNAT family N-acetyltransferase [Flammeovirgaceae bacterium]|nr:GNAT family N-acetyltransferase [Flammeovirgaceae bacterium]
MIFRTYSKKDLKEVTQLFYDTIHTINIRDYSQEQVNVWAPEKFDLEKWDDRMSNSYSVLAFNVEKLAGFATLVAHSLVDFFYIHKDFQGRGVGRMLYELLEKEALELGTEILTTEASITAKPFFERMGFEVEEKQSKLVKGVELNNFRMKKIISS